MNKLLTPIHDFFFKPQTAKALGLFRIVLGLLTLYSFALWGKDIIAFFSDAGLLTNQTLHANMNRDMHTVMNIVRTPAAVVFFYVLLMLFAFTFTLGFWTRASAILLFILVTSFHETNNLVLNSGDTVLRTLLFLFMFAPAGAAYSFDSLWARLKKIEAEVYSEFHAVPWAQRMMQFQVVLIYITTAYAKTRGDLWHSGHAMYYISGLVDFNIKGVEMLMNIPVLYSFLTFGTVFAEIAIPFLLWSKGARPYAVLMGIALHGWIIVFMTIPVFGIIMISTYILFFSEEELDIFISNLRRRFAGNKGIFYYDGDCALCQRSKKIIQILDIFARTEFVNLHESPAESWPQGKEKSELLKEMHLKTPGGEVLAGYDAFRWLALRIPAAMWLAPFMWIPGAQWIGRKIYTWVAKNRYILVTCDNSSQCSVHREESA